MENKEEIKYLELLEEVLNLGEEKTNRTSIKTISRFGGMLRFSLENNSIPILTTKKMFYRGAIEEMLFFARGDSNTKHLEEKGINIWKGNTSREFLDKRGLYHLPEGDMGKGYGFQWRNFNGTDSTNGVDQLKNAIETLKTDPSNRRILISAWNPSQINECALPPCHTHFYFYSNNGYLSCQFYMRSIDMFLGLPFDLIIYGTLTHIIAKACNLKPKELVFSGGDMHIYENHIEAVKTQLNRKPYNFPKMHITKSLNSINDIESLEFKDFVIEDYISHNQIKTEMAV